MTTINLNSEALQFLDAVSASELNLALVSADIFNKTYKFFGDIASFNRIGILYIGGGNINVFFNDLSAEMDQRMTNWICTVAHEFIVHMESLGAGSFKALQEMVASSLRTTLESKAFPADTKERVDVDLINDAIYFTFFMLHPVLKRIIVENNTRVGGHLNAVRDANGTN